MADHPVDTLTPMLSIVLAEDNLLVREGVRGVLSADPELKVVAACADADELRLAIRQFNPDVVVTDIHMPPGLTDEGIQVARELRRDRPGIGVVVLSSRDDPQHALDLLEHGSAGRAYLLKERVAEPGQLRHAVNEVAAGRSVIDPQVVENLVRAGSRPASSPLSRLTPRELEVLGEMAQGRTNGAIALRLYLTVRGVERHINALFAKLGLSEEQDAHHRVRAVLLYLSEH
ncbi:DNA-binding response regulator, NarL/FixJ family, contains REC and HTH domains [Nakamurella panacisegetis]|uniref:DNA-binding response regulator, NarL/FixJ family, contains REC and HTH domains n=2 Tax=Nakamurella panacisegetis TaxID=1090615 RepID=A0A1H0KIA9_9ACTN|nr:DNA-binding response regulator, NarL/FixJ family, contains REC and HTH domains [Nakamurella panacisegetis]